jgi:hypothetical protein
MASKFRFNIFGRNLRDGLDFHVAKVAFPSLRLQTDLPGCERRGRIAVETLGLVQPHDNLAVDNMNAVAMKGNKVKSVPFALGLLGIHLVRAVIANRSFFRKSVGVPTGS